MNLRKPLIAGNWKMNATTEEAIELVSELKEQIETTSDVEVCVCPPFTALKSVSTVLQYGNSAIALGAQNMHMAEKGAFTGEISPIMLTEIGATYVILGHSERREHLCETDEMVNKKVKSALSHNLTPIICVGETLEEKEEDRTEDKIKGQVLAAMEDLSGTDVEKTVFAYEPIWAIGTGKTATSKLANDVVRFIRSIISTQYGTQVAGNVRILYGGSVTDKNIGELIKEPEIDGALVGGASLVAQTFAGIISGALAARV